MNYVNCSVSSIMLFLFSGMIMSSSGDEKSAARGLFQAEFIFEPCQSLPMNHGSMLAEMPDGDILCAWYAGSEEGARDVKIYAARLAKGSRAWSEPEVIADTADRSEGNPMLFVDDKGKVWLYFVTIHGLGWSMAKMKYAVSEDGGRTFGPVKLFRDNYGWMTRNHILRLESGTLLMPLYHESLRYSFFMRSTDGGETWQKAGRIKSRPGNLQPAIVELDEGTVLALMRTWGNNGKTWRAMSKDEGLTWSEAVEINIKNPRSATDMVRLSNGHLVIAFNNSTDRRTPLTVALSEDEGKTWPYLRDLETDEGRFSYPSLIQASDGMIHITYTYRRITIKHAVFPENWIQEER
jgi:predicted neuraminidase